MTNNYVFFGDSPELDTGFANVMFNITARLPFCNNIHLWGIGHDNIPHDFPGKLYSAGINSSWRSEFNVNRFYKFLSAFNSPITLFVLQDSYRMKEFVPVISAIRRNIPVRLVAYIPVDSYLTPEDEDFIRIVDVPVAYTKFGAKEIAKYTNEPVITIPHGIDHMSFNDQKPNENARAFLFPNIPEKGIIITNVNTNSARKNPQRTLDIFELLLKKNPNYYLYMHMHPTKEFNLKEIAIKKNIINNVILADPLFPDIIGKTNCPKFMLADIYKCSNLVISTSLGEGWGLTSCEAAACGTPVAVPYHTSFKEIFPQNSCLFLPTSNSVFQNNKYWPYVNVAESADIIHEFLMNPPKKEWAERAKLAMSNYSWDTIIGQWESIFAEPVIKF